MQKLCRNMIFTKYFEMNKLKPTFACLYYFSLLHTHLYFCILLLLYLIDFFKQLMYVSLIKPVGSTCSCTRTNN